MTTSVHDYIEQEFNFLTALGCVSEENKPWKLTDFDNHFVNIGIKKPLLFKSKNIHTTKFHSNQKGWGFLFFCFSL